MIAKLLLLSTALFTFTCSIGGVRELQRDHTKNAIVEEDGITKIDFSYTLTPNFNTFTNSDIFVDMDISFWDDFTFHYDLEVYDVFGTYFTLNDASFNASRYNVEDLKNIKFGLFFTPANDLYNPNNEVDTIEWTESLDFGNGYQSPSNLFYNQYSSDSFSINDISNRYEFVLPIDLIYSFFVGGWNSSYTEGYNEGLSAGYVTGFQDGSNQGYSTGYYEGYRVGNIDGANYNINFLGLFGAIADTPVLIIRNLLGFDIFGTSALTIFMSLLTACVVIHFIRKFI